MTTSRPALTRRTLLRLSLALPLVLVAPPPVRASERAWEELRAGGRIALIRHAAAPGTGDPSGFALDDCSTQRNLSDGGRAHAVRIGDAFREHGVSVGGVLSSGWCRCVDTASLAFGTTEVWPPLHSFFRDAATEAAQTAEVRERVSAWTGPGTLIMVTHQVNITALTEIFPAEGEIIVLAPAADRAYDFSIVGRVTVS